MVVEDEEVAVRFRTTGTHRKEFHGIEPTDREFDVPGMEFLRIEDGTIAEVWILLDALEHMRQLGVVEPRPT